MGTLAEPCEKSATFAIDPWTVIVLNDDFHTFEEVIGQLQLATGCLFEEAAAIAWEAHERGEAPCYSGPLERCEHVAAILGRIDLGVRIERA
jgi:ATP-dependent Clp protease adapter protein ClpS